jgi:hypothetical protein
MALRKIAVLSRLSSKDSFDVANGAITHGAF